MIAKLQAIFADVGGDLVQGGADWGSGLNNQQIGFNGL